MWYAISEILIFLLIALLLGGVGGYLLAQNTSLRIGRLSKNTRSNDGHASKQLSAARAEITHLQRLVAETDAKSGSTGTRLSKRVAEATDPKEELPDAEAV
jgi:hypothetical protein